MDRLDQYFAWKYFLVAVVALLLAVGFTRWYAEKKHFPPPSAFAGR